MRNIILLLAVAFTILMEVFELFVYAQAFMSEKGIENALVVVKSVIAVGIFVNYLMLVM